MKQKEKSGSITHGLGTTYVHVITVTINNGKVFALVFLDPAQWCQEHSSMEVRMLSDGDMVWHCNPHDTWHLAGLFIKPHTGHGGRYWQLASLPPLNCGLGLACVSRYVTTQSPKSVLESHTFKIIHTTAVQMCLPVVLLHALSSWTKSYKGDSITVH